VLGAIVFSGVQPAAGGYSYNNRSNGSSSE
jgi:hypothetical protein